MKTYVKRFARIEPPARTIRIQDFQYTGATCYNSSYCHFVVGALFQTRLPVETIAKHYENQSVKGANGEREKLRILIYEPKEQNLKAVDYEDKYFADEFLSDEIMPEIPRHGLKNSKEDVYYVLYSESMRLWTVCGTFDPRCL